MESLLATIVSGQQALAAARACDLDAMSPSGLAEATSLVQVVLREAQALNLTLLAAADRKNAHPLADRVAGEERAGVSRSGSLSADGPRLVK